MLPDFVLRILLLVLGYLYPAFECFKIVESNTVDNEQLRFWCQYWIIVAILTAFERIGDIFVSWLPLYSELKLSFVIYLWNSNTKGTTYVYETLLKPFVRGHETEIDQRFSELAARSGDLIKDYVQNAADKGQSMFLEIMQFIMVPSSRKTKSNQKVDPPKRAEAFFGPDPVFPSDGDQARRTDGRPLNHRRKIRSKTAKTGERHPSIARKTAEHRSSPSPPHTAESGDDIGWRYAHAACFTRRFRIGISPELWKAPPQQAAAEAAAEAVGDAAKEGEQGRRSRRLVYADGFQETISKSSAGIAADGGGSWSSRWVGRVLRRRRVGGLPSASDFSSSSVTIEPIKKREF